MKRTIETTEHLTLRQGIANHRSLKTVSAKGLTNTGARYSADSDFNSRNSLTRQDYYS